MNSMVNFELDRKKKPAVFFADFLHFIHIQLNVYMKSDVYNDVYFRIQLYELHLGTIVN